MGFLSKLLGIGGIAAAPFTLGGSLALTGASLATSGMGKKKSKEPDINQILAPFLKQYTDIANKYSAQADVDYTKATAGYDEVLDYYRNILGGSREDLLKLTDSTALTSAIDEQERQNYELAPRGGRRAATAANLSFDKFATLNRYLQSLRGMAPGGIANISQALANMGQGKLAAAMGGTAGGTNIAFGTEQLKQQEEDRKSAMLGSIFEAVGAIAGGFACNTLDTWTLTPDRGYIQLKEIRVGDKIYTLGAGEKLEEAKVIRKEVIEDQEIWKLNCNDTSLEGTLSHVLAGMNKSEFTFQDLAEIITTLPIYKNEELFITTMKSLKKTNKRKSVAILKLNNEKENFNYITNGLISIDADCKR